MMPTYTEIHQRAAAEQQRALETSNRLAHLAGVLDAARKGEPIQHRRRGTDEGWSDCAFPTFNFADMDYRVKPALVTRVLRVEELPFPCLIRRDEHSRRGSVVAIDLEKQLLTVIKSELCFQMCTPEALLAEGWTFSANGRDWLPFNVAVDERDLA